MRFPLVRRPLAPGAIFNAPPLLWTCICLSLSFLAPGVAVASSVAGVAIVTCLNSDCLNSDWIGGGAGIFARRRLRSVP